MGYMSSYKRLDNLCRDCGYIKGVSAYIEEMEQNQSGAHRVPGWQDDYKKLKHYRWVRNRIAHDNYADESNMCSAEDTKWIDNFHQRIIDRTDPLAIYRQKQSAPNKLSRAAYSPQQADHRQTRHRSAEVQAVDFALFFILALVAIAVAIAIALLFFI